MTYRVKYYLVSILFSFIIFANLSAQTVSDTTVMDSGQHKKVKNLKNKIETLTKKGEVISKKSKKGGSLNKNSLGGAKLKQIEKKSSQLKGVKLALEKEDLGTNSIKKTKSTFNNNKHIQKAKKLEETDLKKKTTVLEEKGEKQLLQKEKELTGKYVAKKDAVVGKGKKVENKITLVQERGVEGVVRDNKEVKKVVSKKDSLTGKATALKNGDAEKFASGTAVGKNISKYKDASMGSMLGGKDVKKEKEKLTEGNITKKGLAEFDGKKEEYRGKANNTKAAKIQTKVRQKLYKKRPDYKEVIFRKKKTFLERFHLSGNLLAAENVLQTVSIAPLFEIELRHNMKFHLGPSFQYSLLESKVSKNTMSAKLSFKYTFLDKKVYLYAESQSVAPKFPGIEAEKDISKWQHLQVVGAGVSLKELLGIPINATLLYNFQNPIGMPVSNKKLNFSIGLLF